VKGQKLVFLREISCPKDNQAHTQKKIILLLIDFSGIKTKNAPKAVFW